jgi:hypothetical protein
MYVVRIGSYPLNGGDLDMVGPFPDEASARRWIEDWADEDYNLRRICEVIKLMKPCNLAEWKDLYDFT